MTPSLGWGSRNPNREQSGEAGWAHGLALERRRRLQEGMKKAGGPIWPTAQRFYRRLNRLGLPLGGRRPPARGNAAARGAVEAGALERLRTKHLVYGCLSGRPADIRQSEKTCQRSMGLRPNLPAEIDQHRVRWNRRGRDAGLDPGAAALADDEGRLQQDHLRNEVARSAALIQTGLSAARSPGPRVRRPRRAADGLW
jgi:hypothetical protein